MTDDRIRVAIVGTGMSLSHLHYPILQALPDKFVLHSVVERSGKQTCRRTVGTDVKVVKTLDEVLDDSAVELIAICSPNKTHYEYCQRSLMKGKHVICEKPLVPTAKEAEELFALAKKQKRILTVFQNRRWDADFLTLKELISSGKLGPLTELVSHYDRFRPLSVINPSSWKETPGEYNDNLYNLGSHIIDQVIDLLGEPMNVTARSWSMRGTQGLDDSFSMMLEYPPQSNSYAPLFVHLHARMLSPMDPQVRFVVKGLKGSYTKHGLDSEASDPDMYGSLQLVKENAGDRAQDGASAELLPLEKYPTGQGEYPAIYANLYDAIKSGDESKLAISPDQAVLLLRIIEAGFKSSRERVTVTL
ncbi:hypothetical protein BD324DRAFT_619968 [Kockovaella imperatae]|uniref:Oxidoreductase n=1 Tax=Kockovaella imperatae TaxID=4999 RepID=A0A1Y1UL47_9TREE|nr:hypothetical protein BD324DRAFT_619968 [Kockovaella imperatae]ORX38206.1 hypothetical protein BD324DRAFT_619968 [Kockovaella imperatae]